jgi:hypothetical protein
MTSNLFVVGTTRSGTSALRNALSETRYSGEGEGHTVGLLGALSEAINRYFNENRAALSPGTMIAHWQRNTFWSDIVAAYVRQIRLQFPGGFYLDKTPNILPLHYAKLIEASLEGTRFIFCRRRGIDNVVSKQRKWASVPFREHCTEWRDINERWDQIKGELTSPFLEVDFHEMFATPELLSSRIGEFLEIPEDEQIRFLKSLNGSQPTTPPWQALSEVGWTEDQKATFLATCQPLMTRCNYGLEAYWAT